MAVLSCSLALLSGVIGAGFASGREIAHFFASHGSAAALAVLLCACTFFALFLRLSDQLERAGDASLLRLCRTQFGQRFGCLCAGLFALLLCVTGGAMLCACAELFALTLPVHHAYGIGLAASLIAGMLLSARGVFGLALPGAALCLLLPVLLLRLLGLPGGEAGFSPRGHALHAAASGVAYGALNTAMLLGTLPLLLRLKKGQRLRAVGLFTLLFTLMLTLGVAVLNSHRQAAMMQALPFVSLSRELGKSGYMLCALSMYAAALSTLCSMLAGLMQMLPGKSPWAAALCCLFFSLFGFGSLVTRGYPVLGALCAGLMALLCLPHHHESSSVR